MGEQQSGVGRVVAVHARPAGGQHAGHPVQRVDAEPRIVGQRDLAGLPGRLQGLVQRVLLEGRAGLGLLGELRDVVETEEQVLADDDARRARRLVRTLPAAQREVIEMAYFRGYSQQEIALGMNVPLGTVKGRARLALIKLREASAAGALAGV